MNEKGVWSDKNFKTVKQRRDFERNAFNRYIKSAVENGGYRASDIAKIYRCSKVSINRTLKSALTKLKPILEKKGLSHGT